MRDHSELKSLAESLVAHASDSFYLPCTIAFERAATPSVVLALIADNERLEVDLREQKDAKLGLSWAIGEIMGECDQLKVEIEMLRNLARELRGSAECTNVNHCKSEQHNLDEPCKVLARIDAAISKGAKP